MEHLLNNVIEYSGELSIAAACICIVGIFIWSFIVWMKNVEQENKEKELKG